MVTRFMTDAVDASLLNTAPASDAPRELQRCSISTVLGALYAGGFHLGSRRVMRSILDMALKLEGGEFFSATARQLMSRWHELDIGAYSYGCFDDSRFAGGARVGRYVSIARSVRSYRRNHPAQSLCMHPLFYAAGSGVQRNHRAPLHGLTIDHDVWIGAHALILPGCRHIGIGAIVGAGAVVTRDVEPFSVVVGNPARTIRKRFDEQTVARILRSKWWTNSSSNLQSTIDDRERELLTPEGHKDDER